ncbi:MAG: hypothetical protein L6420_00320, partial [Elusimicrobia bacterium]|nr:hypothetical protein [Elusimicrobiota bacterium]
MPPSIIDINMPNMDGKETFKKLRAQLGHELEQAGYNFEWGEIKNDLKALQETEISHEGKI